MHRHGYTGTRPQAHGEGGVGGWARYGGVGVPVPVCVYHGCAGGYAVQGHGSVRQMRVQARDGHGLQARARTRTGGETVGTEFFGVPYRGCVFRRFVAIGGRAVVGCRNGVCCRCHRASAEQKEKTMTTKKTTVKTKQSKADVQAYLKQFPWGVARQDQNGNWLCAVPTVDAKNIATGDILIQTMSHGRLAFKTVTALVDEKFDKGVHYTRFAVTDAL